MHVVVHGGAGSAPENPSARQGVLAVAAEDATERTTPLDGVCTAVRTLEADPQFNAGVGSVAQSDGVIRTDAGRAVDDGTSGAACGMAGVAHAVAVARVVARETPHVLVAGEPAVALSDAFDVGTDENLWTDRARERWAAADPPAGDPRKSVAWVREPFGRGTDTVGTVATDGESLAAATSTGGRWFALAGVVVLDRDGRVGTATNAAAMQTAERP